jgi:beta-glucanase (GH16 family)
MTLTHRTSRQYLFACLLLSLWIIPNAVLRAAPPTDCPLEHGEWAVVTETTDEFNGETLDSEKWHPNNPKWQGRQPGFFSKDNVEVRDGMLHLTARHEDLPDLPDGYHTFTTAAVKSKTLCLYGYYEIRCRPMDSHASSAFWFYANDGEHWTEIDVFEIGGKAEEHEDAYHMNVHVFITPEEGRKHWSDGAIWRSPYRLADEFHVYGLEWGPDTLRWYVDGEVVRERENTHWSQQLHLNFDSETMGDWFGMPDPDDLPSTFSIDYVRTWRRTDTPATTEQAEEN